MKLAMLRVQEAMDASGMQARMMLTVHDELVFEAPESEREALEALVREQMQGAHTLDVPLTVDVGWGASWGAARGRNLIRRPDRRSAQDSQQLSRCDRCTCGAGWPRAACSRRSSTRR